MTATRSAEIGERAATSLAEGWQAREVRTELDNLMLDVGCDSPPLWCIDETRRPHGPGLASQPVKAGRKPGQAPTPTGCFREQSS